MCCWSAVHNTKWLHGHHVCFFYLWLWLVLIYPTRLHYNQCRQMKPISDTLDQLIWLSQLSFFVSLSLPSISVNCNGMYTLLCGHLDDFSSCHGTYQSRRWGAAPPLLTMLERPSTGRYPPVTVASIVWPRRRLCRGFRPSNEALGNKIYVPIGLVGYVLLALLSCLLQLAPSPHKNYLPHHWSIS
jgi:hypothetical protein